MKLRLGDKIFLIISLVIIGMYVFSGILNDFDSRLYYTPMDPREYLPGLFIILGVPWSIYRIITHLKSKRIKNALQHS